MRFLIAFAAVLGYAAASIISPYGVPLVGPTAGDVQAAAIDATVVATDTARAIGEGHARAAEAAVQWNTEAVRQAAEATRDVNENVYWGNVAASQNLVAAAQSQAAAISGAAAAARAAHLGAPIVGAPIVAAAPLGLGVHGLGLGVHGLGVRGLGIHGW